MDLLALHKPESGLHQTRSRPVVTDTNLAPILQVVTWLMLSAMFLSIAIRYLSRKFLIQRTGFDDFLVTVAFFLASAQCLCLCVPKFPILGRSDVEITPSALANGLKLKYAADLLFYAGLFFAKLSVLLCFAKLFPHKSYSRRIGTICLATTMWWVTTEFAVAFQCSLPDPWDWRVANCQNILAIYLFADVGNIVTDLAILYLPIALIVPLRMRLRTRVSVLLLLSTRSLVVAAAIVQTVYLPRSLRGDFTFNAFPYYINVEVVQALSIVTSSLPFFNAFMLSLQSGSVFVDHLNARINGSLAGSKRKSSRDASVLRDITGLSRNEIGSLPLQARAGSVTESHIGMNNVPESDTSIT